MEERIVSLTLVDPDSNMTEVFIAQPLIFARQMVHKYYWVA
jgi:hypothetical protein